MSLKTFHLVFVGASFVLALMVGVWAVRQYGAVGGAGNLALGILFFVAAIVLAAYGLKVRQKLEELEHRDERPLRLVK